MNRGRGGSKDRKRHRGSGKPRKKGPITRADPSDTEDADVRFIQPYEATKTYLCPGCRHDIPPGMGHMVVVPPDAPDLRRHWHRGCWVNRATRR